MFSENGYAGTSIKAVAAAADTSPENIYLVFGTKSALLRAWIDVSVAGDDARVPFIDRAEVRAVADLSTFRERLATAMAINRAVNERVAAPLAVLDAAGQSDPDIAALSTALDAARHQDIAQLLGVVLGDVSTRGDLDRGAVVDLVAALLSVQLYRALVLTAGWTPQKYEQELGRQVSHAVIGMAAGSVDSGCD